VGRALPILLVLSVILAATYGLAASLAVDGGTLQVFEFDVHFPTATATGTPTATPALGPGTSIEATLTAAGFVDGLVWGVQGDICATNTGAEPAVGLAIVNVVQYKVKGGPFSDLPNATFSAVADGPLPAGETLCMPYRLVFEPVAGAHYRNAARVTILNHSGWLPGGPHCPGPKPCPFGAELKAEFDFSGLSAAGEAPIPGAVTLLPPANDVTPTPAPTETATPAATPTETATPTSTATEPATPTETQTEPPPPTATTATTEVAAPSETPTPEPTATPTSETPGQAGTSLLGSRTIEGFFESGVWGVRGTVCLTNQGDEPTVGLAITNSVQYQAGAEPYLDLPGAAAVLAPEPQLAPGATGCYDYRVEFTPVAGARYRSVLWATILNHADWLPGSAHCPGPEPCAFGPEAKADFDLPAPSPAAGEGVGPTARAPAVEPSPAVLPPNMP
jgi:hypothetical protein